MDFNVFELAIVVENHRDVIRPGHDVVVGQHVTVGRNDESARRSEGEFAFER